jgi:hypothetical protein
MGSGRKKAIFRFLAGPLPGAELPTRDWTAGYLAPEDLSGAQWTPAAGNLPSPADPPGSVPYLDLAGKLARAPLASLKWICFVRDFNLADRSDPERLIRKLFLGRPRGSGLWLRLHLADGDALEGVAANDITLLHPVGLFLTPPDTRGNTQRVFVPRTVIRSLEALGLIGPVRSRRKPVTSTGPELQENLFRSEAG